MLRNALLSVVAIVATIALFNVLAEYFAPREVHYWRTNPRSATLHHKTPDFDVTYRTNAYGLRGPELREKSGFRIVHIGDSFTFGWGVEDSETIPAQLEKRLRATFKTEAIEVINFGVPGTNPFNFYAYATKYALQLRPDFVIVSIYKTRNTYLGGDVASNGGIGPYLKGVEQWAVRAANTDPDAARRDSFKWNFALYRLQYRAKRRIDYQTFGVDWPGPANTVLVVKRNEKAGTQDPLTILADQMLLYPATFKQRSDEVTATVQILAMIQRDSRAPVVVMVLPTDWQIQANDNHESQRIAYSGKMDERIAALCKENGLRCVHGTDQMRAWAKGKAHREISFPADSHYTPEANRVFAGLIHDAIAADVARGLQAPGLQR